MFKKFMVMNHPQNLFASSTVCLAALALVSALTACGGGGSGTATDTVGTNSTSGTSTTGSTDTGPTGSGGTTSASDTYGNLSSADVGENASLNGAIPFPADNFWNQDISTAEVDSRSAGIISAISGALGVGPGVTLTIPYVVVSGSQTKVQVWASNTEESDVGQFPIPANAPVEKENDGHVLVVDKDNHRLYELYQASRNGDNSWNAESSALFHLDSNNVRPTAQPGDTSADAAGLRIFPGLIRYDEASKGEGGIKHALRFTIPSSLIQHRSYTAPATHFIQTSCTSLACMPFGAKLRLKSSFQIPAGVNTETKAILKALKTYGMVLADVGSFYIVGSEDTRMAEATIRTQLRSQIKVSDLEVVQMGSVITAP